MSNEVFILFKREKPTNLTCTLFTVGKQYTSNYSTIIHIVQ